MNRPAVVVIALIALIATLMTATSLIRRGGEDTAGADVPAVLVHVVAAQEVRYRTEALGTLRARESVDITSGVSEHVASVHFQDGQPVRKGDVLVVLEQSEERAQLREARAELAEQEREVQRIEGLVLERAVAESELDQRRTLRDKAEARVEELEARLARRVIRAPFDGLLGLRQISPGSLVAPGTLIATLDDIETLWLDFSIPERHFRQIRPGQPVEAISPAFETPFEGEVVAMDGRIDPRDRSLMVRARIPNPERHLRPGLLMQVAILQPARNALLVPEESVLTRRDQHYLWVVDAGDRTVELRPVEVRGRQPGWAEIGAGLEEGDWIVHEGLVGLRDGTEVRILNADELAALTGAP